MPLERVRLESSVFPRIAPCAFFIEYQSIDGASYLSIFIFPFTGEDMAVAGLRGYRGRKGVSGNRLMNPRRGACCCEQCAGEQERDIDVSWKHAVLSYEIGGV